MLRILFHFLSSLLTVVSLMRTVNHSSWALTGERPMVKILLPLLSGALSLVLGVGLAVAGFSAFLLVRTGEWPLSVKEYVPALGKTAIEATKLFPIATGVARWDAFDALIMEALPGRAGLAVGPRLVKSIMLAESGGDPRTVSRTRRGAPIAFGLMQIRPATARDLGLSFEDEEALFSPATNIGLGVGYLLFIERTFTAQLEQQNPVGRLALVSAAYQAGPGTVKAFLEGRAALPEPTVKYIEQVLHFYRRIQSFYGEHQPKAVHREKPWTKTKEPGWL